MKHLIIALVLCAIAATAFPQDVRCLECDHVASYFRGQGGFIGTVAEGVDEVTFVAACGGVSTTGDAQVQGNTASQLFNHRNGLACDREGGSLEIAGLEDGGWFWITDRMNSAVGPLIRKDVLMNERTDPTDAGPTVETSEGAGAVFVKHSSTGRVGLLPTILPLPEMELAVVNVCDYNDAGAAAGANRYSRETRNCILGDGRTAIRAQGPTDIYTGRRSTIASGGHVLRPVADGSSVTVTFDLWGNGSGHYTTAAGGNARLGHPGGVPLTAAYSGRYGSGGGTGVDQAGGTSEGAAGLSIATDSNTNVATLTITPHTSYCGAGNDHSATVTVTANATRETEVTPTIVERPAGTAATHSVRVVCFSASAQQGVELVPENPVPVDG